MMTENIELENALKTWMGQVMQLSMRSFIEYTTETGLSMPQIAVLFLLNGDKHRAVTELGEEFGVSGAAASQMVEKLVQMGFVERREDSNDRRIRRLLLTTKGKEYCRAEH
jgi:DNA-binding MarR family transcriptional regulator